MTALDRALAWFLEPPAPNPREAPAGPASADRPARGVTTAGLSEPDEALDRAQRSTWLRPVADPLESPATPPLGPPPAARPTRGEHAEAPASLDDLPPAGRGLAARRPIGCAAVLGRPGQAEPVAAALALALGAAAHARAASVVVVGPAERVAADVETGGNGQPASGGTRAARRLALRLDAHGLVACPRGRLVWVDAPSEGRQAAVQRAALVGAPTVLAVTAPRARDIEELLAEQDLLLLVMADPEGPLARLAALAPGGVPVAVTRPLPRGPARSLALAGISAPRGIRRLAAGDCAATRLEVA